MSIPATGFRPLARDDLPMPPAGWRSRTCAAAGGTEASFARCPLADTIAVVTRQASIASWRALERAGHHRHRAGRVEPGGLSHDGPACLRLRRRPGAR